MYPTLVDAGPISIKTFGLMLALAFIVGMYWARLRAQKQGVSPQLIMDLSIWIIIASVAGSRLYYVVAHWTEFSGNLWSIINPFQGGKLVGIAGLNMQGGVILAILTGIYYLKIKKMPIWKTADICAPSILLGLSIGRIGCFLNGCCFGHECALPWGLVFPEESAAGWVFTQVSIHPTQLYASLGTLTLFFLVLSLERYKRFDGFTFWITIGVYCIFRFSIDFVRFYEPSQTMFHLGSSTIINNQIISFVGLIISTSFLLHLNSNKKIKN